MAENKSKEEWLQILNDKLPDYIKSKQIDFTASALGSLNTYGEDYTILEYYDGYVLPKWSLGGMAHNFADVDIKFREYEAGLETNIDAFAGASFDSLNLFNTDGEIKVSGSAQKLLFEYDVVKDEYSIGATAYSSVSEYNFAEKFVSLQFKRSSSGDYVASFNVDGKGLAFFKAEGTFTQRADGKYELKGFSTAGSIIKIPFSGLKYETERFRDKVLIVPKTIGNLSPVDSIVVDSIYGVQIKSRFPSLNYTQAEFKRLVEIEMFAHKKSFNDAVAKTVQKIFGAENDGLVFTQVNNYLSTKLLNLGSDFEGNFITSQTIIQKSVDGNRSIFGGLEASESDYGNILYDMVDFFINLLGFNPFSKVTVEDKIVIDSGKYPLLYIAEDGTQKQVNFDYSAYMQKKIVLAFNDELVSGELLSSNTEIIIKPDGSKVLLLNRLVKGDDGQVYTSVKEVLTADSIIPASGIKSIEKIIVSNSAGYYESSYISTVIVKNGKEYHVNEYQSGSDGHWTIEQTIKNLDGTIVDNGPRFIVPNPALLQNLQFIGATSGKLLAEYIADGNIYKGIVLKALLPTITEHFGTFAAFASKPNQSLEALLRVFMGEEVATGVVLAPEFSATFYKNLNKAVSSALGGVIIDKVGDALGLEGTASEVFSAVGSTVTVGIASEAFDFLFKDMSSGSYLSLFNNGFDFDALAYNSNGTKIIYNNKHLTIGDNIKLQALNALGAFVGGKLASAVIHPESKMAAFFGSAGSALGTAIATGEIFVGSAIKSVFSAISNAGWLGGPVGVAIGVFVGQVLGTVLGNLFSDDSKPAAWAGVQYDIATKKFVVGTYNGYAGGDAQVAHNMAKQVVDGINSILGLTKGILRQGSDADRIEIGFEGSDFIVSINGTAERSFGTHGDAVMYAAFKALKDFDLVGGHAVLMRAWHNSTAQDLFEFKEDLQVAEAFQNYLLNPTGIMTLMMNEPNSTLAQSWAKVLQRATELKLHLPHEDDFDGGWGEVLLANGVDPELIPDISGDSIVLTDPVTGEKTIIEHVIGPGYEIVRIPGTDGDDIIQVVVNGPSVTYVDAGSGNDIINGSEQADIILGGIGDDTINGLGGNDWLHGGRGNDSVDGGNGDDLVIGGSDNDYLYGGAGADKIYGNAGNDVLQGLGGVDYLYGGLGDDIFYGDYEASTDDYMYGGEGNDTFYGRESDAFIGGAGNDRIVTTAGEHGDNMIYIGRGDGHDIIEGGGSTTPDRLIFDQTISPHELFYKRVGDDLKILVLGEDQSVTVKEYFSHTNGPRVKIFIKDFSYVADNIDPTSWWKTVHAMVAADATLAEQPTGQYNYISDSGLAQRDAWQNFWRFTMGNSPGNIMVQGTNASETLLPETDRYQIITGRAGNDILNGYNHSQFVPEFLYGDSGDDILSAGSGHDTLVGGLGNDTLHGGADRDKLLGGYGVDTINGDDGDDEIWGGQGNDIINGGLGDDRIYGGDNDDQITDPSGNNIISGGNGNDTITLTVSGNQVVYGDDGIDTLTTAGGSDKLSGGAGNDTLSSGAGDDTVNGGDGDDLIYGNAGTDTIEGGSGIDTITYASSASWINISLKTQSGSAGDAQGDKVSGVENVIGSAFNDTIEGSVGNNILTGGAGTDTLSFANIGAGILFDLSLTSAQNTINAGTDTVSGFENVTGSAFADTLIGDANANILIGGDGNDVLDGGAGNDTLNGGLGDDTASYRNASSAVTVSLAVSSAQNTGGAGTDTLSGMQNLIGSAFNDTLTGDSSGNIIEGGLGNDVLNGGAGTDTVSFVGASVGVTVNLATTTAQNTGVGSDTITAFESIIGSSFNDTLTGDSANNVIEGGAGNDVMDGGSATDTATYSTASAGVTVSLAITTAQDTIGAGVDTLINFERLTGSAFNDVLTGNSSNNQIEGGAGNDIMDGGAGTDTLSYYASAAGVTVSLSASGQQNTVGAGLDTIISFENITGSAFNDTLIGSNDANSLKGGSGDDTIDGGAGNDVLAGESGIDTVSYVSANTGVLVDLSLTTSQNTVGGGSDTLTGFENLTGSNYDDVLKGDATANTLKGGIGNDILDGGAGDDKLMGEAGLDTARYSSASAAVTVNLATTIAQNTGGAGTDILSGIENLIGSAFNDTLTGDGNANVLEGGLGDDILTGAAGLDTVSFSGASSGVTVNLATTTAQNTGAGLDTIAGFENILGSGFNDILTGDDTANVIEGGAGDDNLNGGNGIDTAAYVNAAAAVTVNLATVTAQNTIGAGTDILVNFENLTGSAFGDTLTGSTGDNVIDGGAGNDTVQGGAGNDTLLGGAGVDTLSYAASGSAITLNLATTTVQNTGGAGSDTVSGFENILGSGYGDTLTGDAGDNTIDGGNGSDIIDGGNGNDTLIGGASTDTLTYATALSAVNVSLALTTVQNTGGSGNDTISGFERLTGSAYNDVLTGDAADNILSGGDGDDVLDGGDGNDTLSGGNGIDTARYTNAASAVTVSLAVSTAQNTGGAGTDTLSSIQALIGSSFNDTLTGSSNDDTIEGGLGNDVLAGGSGGDTVSYVSASGSITVNLSTTTAQNTGAAGTDTITAFENIRGSDFNDTLTGDGNANIIEGGLGNDTLDGGAGTDTLSYKSASSGITINIGLTTAQNTVGAGTDTVLNFERIIGSAYNDILTGNSSTNQIEGGVGNDIMDGGAGTDTLAYQTAASGVTVNLSITTAQNTGGAGVDTISNFESITGSGYNDILYGSSGNNTLKGGNGNDILCGLAGADSLYGEAGADTFLFDVGSAFSGIDTINDFSTAQGDKLNISSLLVGYNAVQSAINDFVSFTVSGSNSTMLVDRDGTASTYAAQSIATLNNLTGLDANTLLTNGYLVVV